jgi:hypothetical protein
LESKDMYLGTLKSQERIYEAKERKKSSLIMAI